MRYVICLYDNGNIFYWDSLEGPSGHWCCDKVCSTVYSSLLQAYAVMEKHGLWNTNLDDCSKICYVVGIN